MQLAEAGHKPAVNANGGLPALSGKLIPAARYTAPPLPLYDLEDVHEHTAMCN